MVKRVLQLGCGLKRIEGAVNVDLRPTTNPDVVHNLDERPWPFENDQFDEVVAYDVIEHLDDIIATMEEVHRVATNGAVVKLTVPHFSCPNSFTDITHRHCFTWFSFHYFTGEN